MSKKPLSSYGYNVLDELERERKRFYNREINCVEARATATLCNACSRAMGETLRIEKYKTSIAIANS